MPNIVLDRKAPSTHDYGIDWTPMPMGLSPTGMAARLAVPRIRFALDTIPGVIKEICKVYHIVPHMEPSEYSAGSCYYKKTLPDADDDPTLLQNQECMHARDPPISG